MKSLGIAVGYPSAAKGRPVVTCVALVGTRASATVLDVFDLKTSADSPVDQVVDLAKALSSKLSGMDIDALVIRRADRPPVANRAAAPHKRLLIEGAFVLVSREHCDNVAVRDGQELGEALGSNKAAAVAAGKGLDSRRADAAAAALTGLA